MEDIPREDKIKLSESLTQIRNKVLAANPAKGKKLTPFKYT